MKPRATSEGRKEVGANRINQANNVNKMASANSSSSAAGIARGGKSPSRILPAEGGQFRAVVVRVRVELARRPKETRPVAEGKLGEAATRVGELRPVVNLN